MGQASGYQATIERLYALYQEQGFLCEKEALALMTADGVTLVGINRVTDKLIDMGVVFYDASLDESDDYSQLDYETIFREALEISPELKPLINYIRETRPPQWREWQILIPQMNSGNDYAFNRLFDMYLRIVVNIALRFCKDSVIELDDAIQEGVMGLMRAIKQFDIGIHGALASYVPLWVQQHISRAVADKGRVIRLPVHVVANLSKIHQTQRQLTVLTGNAPSTYKLAEETGLPVGTIETLLNASQEIMSLESLIEDDADFDIVDINSDVFEIINKKSMKEQLYGVLGTITPREEHILHLRYGMEDGEEHTLEDIGDIFGVTRERVRQIEEKALRKLRHPSRSRKIKDFL